MNWGLIMPERFVASFLVLVFAGTVYSGEVLIDSEKYGSFSSGDRASIVRVEDSPFYDPGKRNNEKRRKVVKKDRVSEVVRDDRLINSEVRTVEAIRRVIETAPALGVKQAAIKEGVPGLVLSEGEIPLTTSIASFPGGRFLAAAPSGTLEKGRWTGIGRWFEMEDGSIAHLTETDLDSSNGRVFFTPEGINAEVHGKPASTVDFDGENGRFLERVLWVYGKKNYLLMLLRPERSIGTRTLKGEDQSPRESALDMARKLPPS